MVLFLHLVAGDKFLPTIVLLCKLNWSSEIVLHTKRINTKA